MSATGIGSIGQATLHKISKVLEGEKFPESLPMVKSFKTGGSTSLTSIPEEGPVRLQQSRRPKSLQISPFKKDPSLRHSVGLNLHQKALEKIDEVPEDGTNAKTSEIFLNKDKQPADK
jgi:hypothetical protein